MVFWILFSIWMFFSVVLTPYAFKVLSEPHNPEHFSIRKRNQKVFLFLYGILAFPVFFLLCSCVFSISFLTYFRLLFFKIFFKKTTEEKGKLPVDQEKISYYYAFFESKNNHKLYLIHRIDDIAWSMSSFTSYKEAVKKLEERKESEINDRKKRHAYEEEKKKEKENLDKERAIALEFTMEDTEEVPRRNEK